MLRSGLDDALQVRLLVKEGALAVIGSRLRVLGQLTDVDLLQILLVKALPLELALRVLEHVLRILPGAAERNAIHCKELATPMGEILFAKRLLANILHARRRNANLVADVHWGLSLGRLLTYLNHL